MLHNFHIPQKFFQHSYDLHTNFVVVAFTSVHSLPKCDIYVLVMPPWNPKILGHFSSFVIIHHQIFTSELHTTTTQQQTTTH